MQRKQCCRAWRSCRRTRPWQRRPPPPSPARSAGAKNRSRSRTRRLPKRPRALRASCTGCSPTRTTSALRRCARSCCGSAFWSSAVRCSTWSTSARRTKSRRRTWPPCRARWSRRRRMWPRARSTSPTSRATPTTTWPSSIRSIWKMRTSRAGCRLRAPTSTSRLCRPRTTTTTTAWASIKSTTTTAPRTSTGSATSRPQAPTSLSTDTTSATTVRCSTT